MHFSKLRGCNPCRRSLPSAQLRNRQWLYWHGRGMTLMIPARELNSLVFEELVVAAAAVVVAVVVVGQ